MYNNYKDLNKKRDFCVKPWKTMTIDWNGDVLPCGAIYDCEKYNFGNLLKQDFMEVWNSVKYIKARNSVLGKEDNDEVICSICKSNGYPFL